MCEATGCPGIQCSGASDGSNSTLRAWIWIGPGSISLANRVA